MKNKILSVFIFLLIKFTNICSQNISSFYSSLDKMIGIQNTNLSYGVIFKEKYRKINDNHNYFLKSQFTTGDITYRGDSYFNVKLKYELVDDMLILNINNNQHNISIIPEKAFITKFSIHNSTFIYTKEHGFLEEITSKKLFSVYKKHKKTKKENRDKEYAYYTFKKKEKNLLYYNKKYYFIKSKKDFMKIFPNNKKLIIKFYKKNRFLLKNDLKKFIIKLINEVLIELEKE